MKENNKNKNYEFVLLERLESKVDILIEGQKIMEERVEKIDLLLEDMDYVKSTLADNKKRFKETADKTVVDDHEKRLVKLENAALAKA